MPVVCSGCAATAGNYVCQHLGCSQAASLLCQHCYNKHVSTYHSNLPTAFYGPGSGAPTTAQHMMPTQTFHTAAMSPPFAYFPGFTKSPASSRLSEQSMYNNTVSATLNGSGTAGGGGGGVTTAYPQPMISDYMHSGVGGYAPQFMPMAMPYHQGESAASMQNPYMPMPNQQQQPPPQTVIYDPIRGAYLSQGPPLSLTPGAAPPPPATPPGTFYGPGPYKMAPNFPVQGPATASFSQMNSTVAALPPDSGVTTSHTAFAPFPNPYPNVDTNQRVVNTGPMAIPMHGFHSTGPPPPPPMPVQGPAFYVAGRVAAPTSYGAVPQQGFNYGAPPFSAVVPTMVRGPNTTLDSTLKAFSMGQNPTAGPGELRSVQFSFSSTSIHTPQSATNGFHPVEKMTAAVFGTAGNFGSSAGIQPLQAIEVSHDGSKNNSPDIPFAQKRKRPFSADMEHTIKKDFPYQLFSAIDNNHNGNGNFTGTFNATGMMSSPDGAHVLQIKPKPIRPSPREISRLQQRRQYEMLYRKFETLPVPLRSNIEYLQRCFTVTEMRVVAAANGLAPFFRTHASGKLLAKNKVELSKQIAEFVSTHNNHLKAPAGNEG